ncbi:hypothetical protein [Actinoplanes sp. RD1]|uniref:hypothetical protein n=1 Tax=Actinoplanes sp. RD1 TaxID=3064538 RepID=UPI00274258C1|nr:hypothetical protein [Actinoplanes sp. RD1]
MTELRLAARLARRFCRSRTTALSTSLVAVAAAFVLAMFVILGTLSLSGSQVAERDLGRFGASAGYGSVVAAPGDGTVARDFYDRVAATGARDVTVVLSATDVQVATTPVRTFTMLETSWAAEPYPARYRLLSGRWPAAPGEVAVTDTADLPATPGTTLPVLGGGATLRIVGTVDDRYATTTNLLVAPGTWAGLDPGLAGRFPALGAQPFVLWNDAGAGPDAVVTALTDAVRRAREAGAPEASPDFVGQTVTLRADLLDRPERTWIDKTPAGYTIPALLLPVAAVWLVFGLGARSARRAVTRTVMVGVRPRTAVAATTAATLLWCLAATAAGLLAGLGIGSAARVVVAGVRDRPAGPVGGLLLPVLQFVALVVVTGVVAGGVRARSRSGVVRRRLPVRTAARLRDARQLLTVATGCYAVLYAFGVDSPAKAMMLAGLVTAAVLLAVPELFRLLLRLLPEGGPRRRLARRQLAADPQRAMAGLAVLTLLLGGCAGFLTLLSTMLRTADTQAYPDTLPGQVLLTDRASAVLPPPAAVERIARAAAEPHATGRAELRYAFLTDRNGDLAIAAARQGRIGNLLVLDSPEQVEQLVGHALTARQRAALTGGGLAVWADAPDPDTPARVEITDDGRQVGLTAELPSAAVEAGLAGWRVGTDGVLLTDTATRLRLPVTAHGPVLWSGLDAAEATAVQQAVERAGLDARTVQLYAAPPPPVPPAALVATAVASFLLVLAATLTATRAQTRVLRGYLATLIAVGISPSWGRQVLCYQLGALTLLATALAGVIALVPALVISVRVTGFVLSVPWGQLAVLLASIYLATGLAALHALRRLRATSTAS